MKGFETIDISGDAGLRIFGGTLEELFSNAALGLYSLITDLATVKEEREISITARGDTFEGLLVAFLNELIFNFDTTGFLGKKVAIGRIGESSVEASLLGEEFDPERHEGRMLVKAATYHEVAVGKSAGAWTATVIFDI